MGKISFIDWCTSTWNPWVGCKKCSAGCLHCYMYKALHIFGKDPSRVIRSKTQRIAPLKWKTPSIVFVCSWSDFFIEEADDWRAEAWEVMKKCPRHTYLLLTKRPQNVLSRLPADWGTGYPNVWLGVTVESPEYLWRLDLLLDLPAAKKFVSYEPALNFVEWRDRLKGIDWLLCGGESGSMDRPLNFSWIHSTRFECAEHKVPLFFKQIGGNKRIDKSWGGNRIDGVLYQDWPVELRAIKMFHVKHPKNP